MKTVLTSTQLVRNLGDCLARVKYRGESFLIKKNEEVIAEIHPAGDSGEATWSEIASALALLPTDPGFADDLEKVNQLDTVPENPWA